MRRLLINLFCLLIPVSFFAQELSENLESYQVTVVGNQIILSGFKALSKDPVFEVYLCDKNLVVQKSYSKPIPTLSQSWNTSKSGDLFVFVFYGTGDKEKYRIALDANLIEKYAGAPDEKARKTTDADKTIFVATDWTYDGSYANDYIIDDLLIDAQMTGITCYSVSDPVQGTYKKKWDKDFSSGTYVKMEILGVQDRTIYILAVQSIPENIQKFLAINIDDGNILFSTELNESDSLDAVSVSTFFIKGDVIYLGGTYVASDPAQSYAPVFDNFSNDNEKRGYDDLAPYIFAPADGYYVMTVDAKKGAILKMKTFGFPSIDKTVDYRNYRLAICHGITPLTDGKMLAFFELISSPYNGSLNGGFMSGGSMNSVYDQQVDPIQFKWETDAFTSVIFNADMSDFNSTTMKWEEESCDYDLSDYDLFSLAPMQEVPHDFCTLGDEGAYPQNFVCDGTTWIYHVHGPDEKSPDFLIKTTEMDQKSIKLLPPGLLLLRDNKSGLQVKTTGQSVKVKILALE